MKIDFDAIFDLNPNLADNTMQTKNEQNMNNSKKVSC